MTVSNYFRLKFKEAVRSGRIAPDVDVERAELVAGPIVFGSFVYKPQYSFGVVVRKWKRVGVSGPWIQEFGGVS